MASLASIFGSREVSALVTSFDDEPHDHMALGIFQKGLQIPSDDPRHVEWDEVVHNRGLAPVVGLTSPGPEADLTERQNKVHAACKIMETRFIPADRLFYDRTLGQSSMRDNAAEVLALEVKDAKMEIDRTLEFLAINTLLGKLTVNKNLIPNSDQSFVIDWTKAGTNDAEHHQAYDNSAAADWSQPATLIRTEIKAIVKAFRIAAGMLPGHAIIGDDVEDMISNNTDVLSLLKNEGFAKYALSADSTSTEVMNGLGLGQLYWEKHLGGYVPKNGNFTDFFPTKTALILPRDEKLKQVLGWCECFGLLPSKLWGTEDDVGIEKAPSPGYHGWTERKTKPLGIELTVAWIGLPVWLNSRAGMKAKVAV